MSPPRGPEIVDPDLLMQVTTIATRLLRLSPDAVRGFACIVDRFELGQRRYGAPDIDGRDWEQEAIEELQDLIVYRGLGLLGRRRQPCATPTIVRIPEPPTVAISFDTSDVELVHPMDDEPTLERVLVAHAEGRP